MLISCNADALSRRKSVNHSSDIRNSRYDESNVNRRGPCQFPQSPRRFLLIPPRAFQTASRIRIRTPAHTGRPFRTVRTGSAQTVSKRLKNCAVPCLLNGRSVRQADGKASPLVKTARKRRHIRADIATEPPRFASVKALRHHGFAEVDGSRNTATVIPTLNAWRLSNSANAKVVSGSDFVESYPAYCI